MSKKNKLTVSQQQKLEEWNKKIETADGAINEGKKFLLTCCKNPFDNKKKFEKIAREIYPKYFIKNEDLNEKEIELINDAFYG